MRIVSLVLAAVSIGGPIDSLLGVYAHYSRKIPTRADILESKVTRAGSKGMGGEYYLHVRYNTGNREAYDYVTVTSNALFPPRPGGTIGLFFDPKTGHLEDDIRLSSWAMVFMGVLAAAALVVLGFIGLGRLLKNAR